MVVISGAGPAGLLRGIQSLCNSNPTIILEKRSASNSGRGNRLLINSKSIEILKNYGIYQHLVENKKIISFRATACFVSINDLEKAMKIVLQEISATNVIYYDSQIEEIIHHTEKKIDLKIATSGQPLWIINSVDLLVIAEGIHSKTNYGLIHNEPIEILPSIKGIITISKPGSRTKYITHVKQFLCHFYYHFAFLFMLCKNWLTFWNPSYPIAKTVIINTPGQTGIAIVFSKKETEKFLSLYLSSKEENKSKQLEKFQQRSISLAQWHTNYSKLLSLILRRKYIGHFGLLFSIDQISITEFGTSHSKISSGFVGNTPYLIAGDALISVDPFTGLGCNSALQTSKLFQDFLQGMNTQEKFDVLINKYDLAVGEVIEELVNSSVYIRHHYRPDTLTAGQYALRCARAAILAESKIVYDNDL